MVVKWNLNVTATITAVAAISKGSYTSYSNWKEYI